MSTRHFGDTSTYSPLELSSDLALDFAKLSVHKFLFGSLTLLCRFNSWDTQLLTGTWSLIVVPEALKKNWRKFSLSLVVKRPLLGLFYLSPKLHKTSDTTRLLPLGCPCRPISSMIQHPCSALSALVHALLSPPMKRDFLPEFIQDTPDFLRQLEAVTSNGIPPPPGCAAISPESSAFSLDVSSLYTNMPWVRSADAGRRIRDNWCERNDPDHPIRGDHLFNLILIVLLLSVFLFNGRAYRQRVGMGMGVSLAVEVANFFMSLLLVEFFSSHPRWLAHIPFLRRYIDALFGFFNGDRALFDEFVAEINTWSLQTGWMVQFAPVSFGCTVPFLDVLVYVKNLTWQTRLFCKPTDLHAFLHTSSFHPAHVVKNIPFGVALRIRRICSEHSVYWDSSTFILHDVATVHSLFVRPFTIWDLDLVHPFFSNAPEKLFPLTSPSSFSPLQRRPKWETP